MLSLIVFLLIAVFAIAVLEWIITWKLQKIPGPIGWPILYNLPMQLANRDDLYQHYARLCSQYGKMFSLRMPLCPRIVCISEPESVEWILKKNFDNYIKGPNFIENLQDFLGNGIFNTNGKQWQRNRHIASRMFTVAILRDMSNIFADHADKAKEILQKKAASGESIDMQDLFSRFTLDSFGEIGFGVDFNSINEVVRDENSFSVAFNTAAQSTDKRFFFPLWKYFPWIESERKLRHALEILNKFAFDLIQKRREQLLCSTPDHGKKVFATGSSAEDAAKQKEEKKMGRRKDLLTFYLELKDDNGEDFSDQYLRDMVLNYMIAGRDTTAQTLTWTFYNLSENPEVQARVVKELDETLKGETPNYDNVKNLRYLNALINETLRMFPPVPIDPKYAVEDDVLPNGTEIKKGTQVEWSAWVMGRHPDFWTKPNQCIPERWLQNNSETSSETPSSVPQFQVPPFIPFQYGPRTCLGIQMAFLEVKVMVSLMLQKFTLKMVPGHPVVCSPAITLYNPHGMRMTVHERN